MTIGVNCRCCIFMSLETTRLADSLNVLVWRLWRQSSTWRHGTRWHDGGVAVAVRIPRRTTSPPAGVAGIAARGGGAVELRAVTVRLPHPERRHQSSGRRPDRTWGGRPPDRTSLCFAVSIAAAVLLSHCSSTLSDSLVNISLPTCSTILVESYRRLQVLSWRLVLQVRPSGRTRRTTSKSFSFNFIGTSCECRLFAANFYRLICLFGANKNDWLIDWLIEWMSCESSVTFV